MELVRQRTGNILPLTAPLGNGAGDGVGLEDCEVVFLARKGTEISSVQNRGEDSRQQLVGVSSQETQHVSHVVQPDSWPSALDAESFVERESLKHKVIVELHLKCLAVLSSQTPSSRGICISSYLCACRFQDN